jgi:phospholipase/carboxylesterase
MTVLLETIELETAPNPDASVIWMHGLGADGNDFVPVVPELRLPATPGVRFIFPNAPMQPVSINNGYVMRAWYDVKWGDLDRGSKQADADGVRASQAAIDQLIAREMERGIASNRIVLAGFSQGGAIALQTGVRSGHTLGGIMALSTYLPMPESVADEAAAANRKTPIFMAHGTQDPVVPYEKSSDSLDALTALGYAVEWHEYPMQHSVCMEEIVDISDWLQRVLFSR